MNAYWSETIQHARQAAQGDISMEPLPIRSNENSDAYSLRFNGIGDYPLHAYLHIPKTDAPHIPLFQAPGYGSVVGVPLYERRARYIVMALCHRGQRLSNSQYSAAYPGLLTDGLGNQDSYVWRNIVADCITAINILLQQPGIDASRLAISGADLAWLTAAFTPRVNALLTGGFIFADLHNRLDKGADYPIAEFDDFKRTHPERWDRAKETLAYFDPMNLARDIDARKIMLSCGKSETDYYNRLAEATSAETTVRANLAKGHLDHVAQEAWLAKASDTTPGPAHYPRSS